MAAELTRNRLTMLDIAKRSDPNGDTATIVDIMAQENQILQDAVWGEGNDTFSHQTTQVVNKPAGATRLVNGGYSTGAASTRQIVDSLCLLGEYSECDKLIADAAPNPKEFRNTEATLHISGIGNTLAGQMIYGNGALEPKDMTGLAPRMATLSVDATAKNTVLGCSGSGSDLTSVYFVKWGLPYVFMFYPRNMPNVGVKHTDLGEVTLEEFTAAGAATGRKYQGYRDLFEVKAGMAVRDPRAIGRVCNIESEGSSNLWSDTIMLRVRNRMVQGGQGAYAYMNETVKTQADVNAAARTNVFFTSKEVYGVEMDMFRGIPLRRVDQILNTESQVS